MSVAVGRVAATGAKLLLAGQLVRAVSQLVGLVVLSRLLDPSVFGIAATATVVMGLGELVRDAGLTTAALRAPTMSESERSGLFWLNVIVGFSCAAALVLAAPTVSSVFGGSLPISVILVLSCVFVINGVSAQYRADLLRTMNFRPVALADAAGAGFALALGVSLAIAQFELWALILQIVAAYSVSAVLVVAHGRWRPQGLSTIRSATKFLRFGAGMTASQIFGYLGDNVDVIALSLKVAPSAIGIYSRSFQIVMAPTMMVQLPIQNSIVPALGRSAESQDGFERLILRSQLAVGILILPIPALIAATAPGLVPIVLGRGWNEAIDIVWLLAGGAALHILSSVAGWLMISQGRSFRLASFSLISLAVKAAVIFPLASGGPHSVALGYTLCMVVLWPLAILWASYGTAIRPRSLILRSSGLLFLYAVSAAGAWVSGQLDSNLMSVGLGAIWTATVFGLSLLLPGVRGVVTFVLRR